MSERPRSFGDREAEREITRRFEDVERRLRDDVEAIVRAEVREAGMSEAQLRSLVRDLVREEMRAASRRTSPGFRLSAGWWRAAAAAAAVAMLLLVGWRVVAIQRDSALSTGATEAAGASDPPFVPSEPAAAGEAAPEPAPVPPPALPTPANFPALLSTTSQVWAPVVARVRASSPPPDLAAALDAWERDPAAAGAALARIENAMVQASANALTGASLAVDGYIDWARCLGSSCPAVRRWWSENPGAEGWPPFTAAAGPDDLRGAGRALVIAYLRRERVARP